MKKFYLLYCLLSAISVNVFCQSYVAEFNNPKIKVKPLVPVKAYAFNLTDVKITGGVFKKAMDLDGAYLLEIEPDRLLHRFREYAGLPVKGALYGGWESETISGHTLGHYLSACAMMYASTHDEKFKERTAYIVSELAICQQARKTGYVGAVPNEDTVFAQVARGEIRSRGFDLNGAWVPWYTMHKVMAGLLDTYLYCGNKQAVDVLNKVCRWIDVELKNLNDVQLQKMLDCEHGGMNEVLVNMYAVTGNKNYLELSYKFHHKAVLDSLARQKDVMQGRHSNTNIPKVIGAGRRYQLTGDTKDSTIADYFWHTIVNHHTYVNGGNSNYEYLGDEDKLNDRLSDNTTETCNTYNMLKLTRQLFAFNPRPEYADFYERALYNHILASQEPDSGMMCYFVPLRMGGKKAFSDKFNSFWCCVGSGIENHSKYGEAIYYRSADGGLFVNLFIPSQLNWKEKNITITQNTSFPESNASSLTVTSSRPSAFILYIRNPWWSANNIIIKVNGKQVEAKKATNGYFAVSRTWKNNDKLDIAFDMHLYTESMPDNKNRVALLYGPVLLAGDLGATMPDPVYGTPVLLTSNHNVTEWVKPVANKPLTFKMQGVGKPFDTELSPFYAMHRDFYSVYWDYFTNEEWVSREAAYKEEKVQQKAIEERTIDIMRLGEMQPERDHNLQGSINSYPGNALTRTGREARAGGFFSFDIKVKPGVQNILLCTYFGDDKNSAFDILINDVKLVSVEWNGGTTGKFYDKEYLIPADMIKDKASVNIRIAANAGKTAGRVFGCRIVTPEPVIKND
ncbi:MAG: beta-L-arabinofuranosidase domain-containing protein [Bacteroidota bacterium]